MRCGHGRVSAAGRQPPATAREPAGRAPGLRPHQATGAQVEMRKDRPGMHRHIAPSAYHAPVHGA